MASEQRGVATRSGSVWVVDASGKPKNVNVRLGITDGTFTELLDGDLKEGDAVIIGNLAAGARNEAKGSTGPRFGF
jgi:HlyD family secretion protein